MALEAKCSTRNVTLSYPEKSTSDGCFSEALTLIYSVCSLALRSNGCDAQSYMKRLHLGDAGAEPTAGFYKMKNLLRWLNNYFWSSCAFKKGSVHCWVISVMQQGGKSGELKIIMSLLGIFELQRGVRVCEDRGQSSFSQIITRIWSEEGFIKMQSALCKAAVWLVVHLTGWPL